MIRSRKFAQAAVRKWLDIKEPKNPEKLNNKEILTKAIQKAITGGFNPCFVGDYPKNWYFEIENTQARDLSKNVRFWNVQQPQVTTLFLAIADLIFSHEFAKAFAGDKWQVYLQAVVLDSEPIKKLEHWL